MHKSTKYFILVALVITILGGCSKTNTNESQTTERQTKPAVADHDEGKSLGHFTMEGNVNDSDIVAYRMNETDYLPEGYEFKDKTEDKEHKVITYQNGEKEIIIEYYWKRSKQDNCRWDKSAADPVLIYNIFDGLFFEEENVLYWNTGIIEYIITADQEIAREEIMKIADSIMS